MISRNFFVDTSHCTRRQNFQMHVSQLIHLSNQFFSLLSLRSKNHLSRQKINERSGIFSYLPLISHPLFGIHDSPSVCYTSISCFSSTQNECWMLKYVLACIYSISFFFCGYENEYETYWMSTVRCIRGSSFKSM